jgi:DNA-directed RNA polymerase specialized sigma24 family protein
MRERTSADRHREVLRADLDRFEDGRGLWSSSEPETAAGERLRADVRAAVAGALTDKQREVVEACFFEGLSQGEVARRLGIAQQVVQKRLYGAPRGGRLVGGAMQRLRTALAPLAPLAPLTPPAPTAPGVPS